MVNWGTTDTALNTLSKVLNKPDRVATAINKITALQTLKEKGCNVPTFWLKKEDIPEKTAKSSIIFARCNIRGSGGDGIKIIREGEAKPDAPLYVLYVRKTAEYRLHVFSGRVIFIQQKRAKEGVTRTADQNLIRCHSNGYVFAEHQVAYGTPEVEAQLKEQAIKAVEVLGLDFGAVDLIVGKDNKVYVLEINSAPGLESTALMQAYRMAIEEARI